jgi:hypothetical protein
MLAIPALCLVVVGICWCRIWVYFARAYPSLKSEYFPHGSALFIPPEEWKRWPEVWRRVRGDKQIRGTMIIMWTAIVLFFGSFILQGAYRIHRDRQKQITEHSQHTEWLLDSIEIASTANRPTMPWTVTSTRGTPAAYAPGVPGFRFGHG